MPENVLILGATSDIGRAIAHRYARSGASLWLAARNETALKKEASDLEIRHDAEVKCFLFEATDFRLHEEWVQALPTAPDVVVLAFGYLPVGTPSEISWDDYHESLQVNLVGAASILHRLIPMMTAQKRGTIIGISSVAGERGRASNYPYGAAKAGFTALLSGIRNELSTHGIHVLTVKPGFVDTRMTAHMPLPAPLTTQPSDLAEAIFSAAKKKRHTLYYLRTWRLIMWIIRNIPERIFQRLSL
ncbi:SDR family oxidoreductase [Pontibacter sp. G13]|uniref:SDR family oxidoreductase n=1 Tax=Pontibacter sp. G13 TaxID=3074898 RepID=UPI00288B509C|nr:SDR family oxidoreductase [Pontibacter sp. G13]WNJ16006.1 SDR family oxidoreductase [Pontibacter sp. G13]